jgi:hypothetical protein
MPDWYREHPHAGPESDAEYREWAQDNGLYVDAAGNVDYGPPESAAGETCPCGYPAAERPGAWHGCDYRNDGDEEPDSD